MGANNKIQKQGKSLDFPNPCGNIPKLRFPEFNGKWEEKRFSDERVRKVCKGAGTVIWKMK